MNLVKSIKELNISESINFEYRLKIYRIKCYHISGIDREKSFAVNLVEGIKRNEIMNVEKITDKYISLYTYNMMSQETKYKMDISKITLIK